MPPPAGRLVTPVQCACSLVTVLGTEGAACWSGTSHMVTVSPLLQHAESKAVKDSGQQSAPAARPAGQQESRGPRLGLLAFADHWSTSNLPSPPLREANADAFMQAHYRCNATIRTSTSIHSSDFEETVSYYSFNSLAVFLSLQTAICCTAPPWELQNPVSQE